MAAQQQVILVMTDTQRWDMVNCYRQTGLQTPNLDRLAAAGVRFNRAYCCQPVCGPARSALFSGQYPHSNGSWGNTMALGDNVKTVGQRLTDAGVHCGYIGKWHLDAGDYFGMGRCAPGWDPLYWYDMRRYLEELSPADRLRSREMATIQEGIAPEFTFGHRCSNRAIDFIHHHRHESFFLVLSYDEPHGPFLCPREYYDRYRDFHFPVDPGVADTLAQKPAHQQIWARGRQGRNPAEVQIRRPEYFGCNSFVDHEIGRVLDAVDAACAGATIIYTSDHGDPLGSHGLDNKGAAMYDEITRIPLLIRKPGLATPGSVQPHPVSHIDLVPTILAEFALPVPSLLEGRPLQSAIADPAVRPNPAVFLEFHRYEIDHDGFGGFQPIRCAFDGRYKLSVNLLSTDELYDLENDPAEMRNRIDAPDCAAARDRLHDQLLDWMYRTRDPFRGYYWSNRPWRRDAPPPSWSDRGYTRQRDHEEYEPRQLDYNTGLPMDQPVRKK